MKYFGLGTLHLQPEDSKNFLTELVLVCYRATSQQKKFNQQWGNQ